MLATEIFGEAKCCRQLRSKRPLRRSVITFAAQHSSAPHHEHVCSLRPRLAEQLVEISAMSTAAGQDDREYQDHLDVLRAVNPDVDAEVTELLHMRLLHDQASAARQAVLRAHNGNLEAAIESLIHPEGEER